MPDLDQHLDEARTDILSEIKAPELADIRVRARTLRRRRHGVAAGAALACLVAVGTGVLVLDGQPVNRDPVPATTSIVGTPRQSVWRGAGLTLYGLTGPPLELPGEVRHVAFVDRLRGYALAIDCKSGGGPPCELALAATENGGQAWHRLSLPAATMTRPPSLVTLGGDSVLLAGGDQTWFSRDGGRDWQATNSSSTLPGAAEVPGGGRLVLGGDATSPGCGARQVEVWLPDGTRARLTSQPTMDVCWAAETPAADGSWWVGGTMVSGGARAPAAAVTRDGGKHWEVKLLPSVAGAPGAWAEVSTLGGEAFAVVVSPAADPDPDVRQVHAIYRSAVGGRPFEPYGDGPGLGTLVGDIVPLLDGRIAAASPDWKVSTRDGMNFRKQESSGSMAWVQRVERTGAYWVAYNLFRGGWVAMSDDGVNWRKIAVT